MPYLGLYLAKTEAQSSIWTSKMGAKWNVKFLSDSLLERPHHKSLTNYRFTTPSLHQPAVRLVRVGEHPHAFANVSQHRLKEIIGNRILLGYDDGSLD